MLKRNFCVLDSNTIVWKRTVFLHNAFYLSRDFCTRSVRDTFYTTRIFCAPIDIDLTAINSKRNKWCEWNFPCISFADNKCFKQNKNEMKQRYFLPVHHRLHAAIHRTIERSIDRRIPGMIPGTWYQGTVGPTCWCFCVWCIYVGPTTEYSTLVQYILKVFCVS